MSQKDIYHDITKYHDIIVWAHVTINDKEAKNIAKEREKKQQEL